MDEQRSNSYVYVKDVYSDPDSFWIPVKTWSITVQDLKALIQQHHVYQPLEHEQVLVCYGKRLENQVKLDTLLKWSRAQTQQLRRRTSSLSSTKEQEETADTPSLAVHLMYPRRNPSVKHSEGALIFDKATGGAACASTEYETPGEATDSTQQRTIGQPEAGDSHENEENRKRKKSRDEKRNSWRRPARSFSSSFPEMMTTLPLPGYGIMYQQQHQQAPQANAPHLAPLCASYQNSYQENMTPTPVDDSYRAFEDTPAHPSPVASSPYALPGNPDWQHTLMASAQWAYYCMMYQQMQMAAYMHHHRHRHSRHHKRRYSSSSDDSMSSHSESSSSSDSDTEAEELSAMNEGSESVLRRRVQQGQTLEEPDEPAREDNQQRERQAVFRQFLERHAFWQQLRQYVQIGLLVRLALMTILLTRGRSKERQYIIIGMAILVYLYHVGVFGAIFSNCERLRAGNNQENPPDEAAQDEQRQNAAENQMTPFERVAARLRVGGISMFNGFGNFGELVNLRERINNQNNVPMWKGFFAGTAALIVSFVISIFPTWLPPPEPQEMHDSANEGEHGNGEEQPNNNGGGVPDEVQHML